MKIELKTLVEQPVDLAVDCSPAQLDLADEDFLFPAPVRGTVRFSLAEPRVIATGFLETVVQTECVRCLKKVELKLRAPVEAMYENNPDLLKPETEFSTSLEETLAWFDGAAIHPEAQLREAVMLALPARPLCSEQCLGLCPVCGANRNEKKCDCPRETGEDKGWKASLRRIKLE
jgi:uncharacterized protein